MNRNGESVWERLARIRRNRRTLLRGALLAGAGLTGAALTRAADAGATGGPPPPGQPPTPPAGGATGGPPPRRATGFLPQIEHVVYVMFENRSLDNVLGGLYPTNSGALPSHMVPQSLKPQFDGLATANYTLPYSQDGITHTLVVGEPALNYTTPIEDPNEGFAHTMNQLFGDATHYVDTEPKRRPDAPMQGFLADYISGFSFQRDPHDIVRTYSPAQLPVLNGLARQYAVSDQWFSSLPSETNPNRAFALCGTSLGRIDNKYFTAIEQFDTPTIWNALAATQNIYMAIFSHYFPWFGIPEKCYTQYTFPQMESEINRGLLSVRAFTDPSNGFVATARAGKLPAFTYIEPDWGFGLTTNLHQGNDYHPPTNVLPGEALLKLIYTALKANREAWEHALLIVTFDEHGGTPDHHAPPWGARPPGDPQSNAQTGFDFELFGVRVPTLLISPYIQPSTVFRSKGNVPYDHTSILATLLKWQGIDPATAGLWNRVAHAPTFEDVLQSSMVNPGIDL